MHTISRPGMRFRVALVATALILTSVTTASSQAASQVSKQPQRSHERARVMRFGVQFSPFNVIDVPPVQATPGDYRAGDYAVFSDVLTDKLGHRVGTEAGTGTITRVDDTGVQILYVLAIELPGGQITASGLGSPDPRKHLAVTGGTGTFTGAVGSILAVENGDADNTGSLQITIH